MIPVNWRRKEKAEEAGKRCPSTESSPGPGTESSKNRPANPVRSRFLGEGRGGVSESAVGMR